MITITLPDNTSLQYQEAINAKEIANKISTSLAKKAIGIKIDDQIYDLNTQITKDCKLKFIVADDNDNDALFLLRHSCAHLLAEAICELYPGTLLSYGPVTENGFFYDMQTPEHISEDDFAKIEKKMQFLIKKNKPFIRHEFSLDEGMTKLSDNKYKQDHVQNAINKGADNISFYTTGTSEADWQDLCTGPHVPSTKFLHAFKLMAISGAYWRGDQNLDQLTRIYGTCFATKDALKNYLTMLEEAKKRDHRKLGKELNLFSIRDNNPGHIFWHPQGWTLYQTVLNFVRNKLELYGYSEVNTPMMMPQVLWEKSGHWQKYQENMFITHEKHEDESSRVYALKPMNCPGHSLIYQHMVHSYRDLPLRLAEFGTVVRHEPTGALHGLFRARSFTQDDAHIFCTEEQLTAEIISCCNQVKELYTAFGFDAENVKVKFSTRPEQRIGSDKEWDQAEKALEDACKEANLNYEISEGEGAFYGPKLEFTLVDSLGRMWQCGTVQIDYLLAAEDRLNITYVGKDNNHGHRPIIIHRALLGSFERFIGIMLEHYAGKLPLYLAPEQIRILPITDMQHEYANSLQAKLKEHSYRVSVDEHSDKLGAKIRRARQLRIPYFVVLGKEEQDNNTVALQKQNGDKLGSFTIEELINLLNGENKL